MPRPPKAPDARAKPPSKALVIARALLADCRAALARGGDEALAGERELAAAHGVSRRTLQQALHILEACAVVRSEQGSGNYPAPESTWRALPQGGQRLLLLCPEERPRSFMFGELHAGIAGAAVAASAELAVMASGSPEAQALGRKSLGRFGGVVVVEPPNVMLVAQLLDLTDRPVVVMEHAIRDLPVVSVFEDSFRSMREAVQALVALGHRRIAMLDREDWAQANAAKFAGYQAGLILAGLDTGRELVRLAPVRGFEPAVNRGMEELWALPARPTALVCFNDAPALAVLDWLRRRGLAAGRDLSLIGSGDGACRQGCCRTLSSIRVHFRRMGEIAALEALCGRRGPQMRAVIVPNRLKLRASVGPPPGAPAG